MGFRKPLTLKRKGDGSLSNGYFTEGAIVTSTIQASRQPLKPEDIQQLPEGRRNSKCMFIFTATKLNLVSSANPDIVVIDSEDYEVDKEEIWQNGILDHYKYLVIKK